MDTQNFEEKLIKMTKPEVNNLKHQDMLAKAITNAKDKSVLSWWWLSIPLYIIAAFLIKTLFVPHTTLLSNINEFANKHKYSSLFIFLLIPIVFIIINFVSVRKIYFLASSPKAISFLKPDWFNVLIIIASILVILIYTL
jgi:hypothetical protein